MSRVTRGAMLVSALAACAWFVLGLRQTHEIDKATSILSQQHAPTAAQSRTAGSLLNSAGTLNPDLEVDVLRARLALSRGEPHTARTIMQSVVRREPQNLEAWIWLARSSVGSPATFRLAAVRVQQLLPHVPPAG